MAGVAVALICGIVIAVIDLRANVDNILKNWGHNVFLQRNAVRHGEGPWDLRANRGFLDRLEKHTVTDRWPNQTGGLTRVKEERREGLVQTVDKIYYFRWDSNPNDGDRIYDGDPNGYRVYLIDWALPARGWKGRIEYWTIGATMETRAEED